MSAIERHYRKIFKRGGDKIASKKFTLNQEDFKDQANKAAEWLIPLGLLYAGSILLTLNTSGHNFSFNDLTPSQAVINASALYVVNQFYGLFKRWKAN